MPRVSVLAATDRFANITISQWQDSTLYYVRPKIVIATNALRSVKLLVQTCSGQSSAWSAHVSRHQRITMTGIDHRLT